MDIHTPDLQRIRPLSNLSPLRERFTPSPSHSPQSPVSPMYQVKYKDYESAIEAIAQLELELSEFQQSSYDLEKELESELLHLEEANDSLKEKNEQLSQELKDLQRSRYAMESETQRAKEELLSKLKNLEDELNKKNSKLVDIEILNDNIEQNERNLNISYQELEEKHFVAEEKVVLLESEISEIKDNLFKEQLNHQNTKNELEDLQIKYEKLLKKQSAPHSQAQQPHTRASSMSRSSSLRQLHSMIEQTKDMESKIDNIKFSLNKNSNLKFNRIKSATTTKITNTTITTSTPSATLVSNRSVSSSGSLQTPIKAKQRIPLSPSSLKLSSLSGAKLNTMEVIEGSPNFKDVEPPSEKSKEKQKKRSIFGGRLH